MGASISVPVGPSRGAFREACVGLLQELRQGLSDNPMDGVVGASTGVSMGGGFYRGLFVPSENPMRGPVALPKTYKKIVMTVILNGFRTKNIKKTVTTVILNGFRTKNNRKGLLVLLF